MALTVYVASDWLLKRIEFGKRFGLAHPSYRN